MAVLHPSHLSPLTSHLFSRSPRPQGKKEIKNPFSHPAPQS